MAKGYFDWLIWWKLNIQIMKFIATILLIVAFTAVYGQCADSNNIYSFEYLGKKYEVVQEEKSWENAASCAVERGGYLVKINDSLEQIKVFDEIVNGAGISTSYKRITNGGGIAYVWIGATDKGAEGDWLWDTTDNGTGSKFWTGSGSGTSNNGAFHNWGGKVKSSINEPDNFGTGQDHGAIGLTGWPTGTTLLGSPGEWNDIIGTSEIYFVIEYDSVNTEDDTSSNNTNTTIHDTQSMDLTPYPNPTQDRIYIKSSKSISAFLLNLQGAVVGEFKNNELDVAELPSGTYWIKIHENQRVFKYPIVVE